MTIDPVTTEVVASRLRETASAMEYALYHSGYSPILRESKDGTPRCIIHFIDQSMLTWDGKLSALLPLLL